MLAMDCVALQDGHSQRLSASAHMVRAHCAAIGGAVSGSVRAGARPVPGLRDLNRRAPPAEAEVAKIHPAGFSVLRAGALSQADASVVFGAR